MKKLKKSYIALAAVGVLSVNLNAQSLQESLANGKVTGAVISVFSEGSSHSGSNSYGPTNNSTTGSMAVQLNYKTADFYGFKAALGFQSGHDFNLHDDATGNTSEDDYRNTVSATSLYNVYLQYTADKTTIKAGKQTIVSPLLMNSGAWAMRDSFNGVTLKNENIPNTQITLHYVKDWYKRYGSDAVVTGGPNAQVDTHYEKPVYSIFLTNKSIKNLRLDAQYLTTNQTGTNGDTPTWTTDSYSSYYTRAMYKLPVSHPITLGLMTAGTQYDNSDDAKLYGIKVATKLGSVEFHAAYTKLADEANYTGTLGHVPNFWSFNNLNVTDDMFAGLEISSIKLGYNFGITGLKSALSLAQFSQSDEGISNSGIDLDGASEYGVDVKYKFTGSFKGLSARLQVAQIDYDLPTAGADSEMTYGKLYLKYAF